MINIPLIAITITIFSICYAILGFAASRRIKTTTDYFVTEKNFGVGSIMLTLIATQLGGGLILGTAQEAYQYGLYGISYTLGISLGFLLLGCGFASRLRALNIKTTAELFEKRCNAPTLKKIASLLSVITMSGILLGQMVGCKLLLTNLSFFNEPVFITFWLLTIGYTTTGGLKAVIWTDIFQALFIILLFSSIFIYSIYSNPTSIYSLLQTGTLFTPAAISGSTLTSSMLMPALFALIEQDLAQRFFAARTKQVATISALGTAIFMFTFAIIPIYFGMHAKITNIFLAPNTNPLIPMLSTITSDFVLALVVCAIIAAIISTADSLLCAIGSNIVQDFDLSWTGMAPLKQSRSVITIIGLTSLVISYIIPHNIITIIVGSYELLVSCLFVPLMYCYFAPIVTKEGATSGIIGGLIGFVLFRIYSPSPIPKEIATLILSLISYLIGSCAARNKKQLGHRMLKTMG